MDGQTGWETHSRAVAPPGANDDAHSRGRMLRWLPEASVQQQNTPPMDPLPDETLEAAFAVLSLSGSHHEPPHLRPAPAGSQSMPEAYPPGFFDADQSFLRSPFRQNDIVGSHYGYPLTGAPAPAADAYTLSAASSSISPTGLTRRAAFDPEVELLDGLIFDERQALVHPWRNQPDPGSRLAAAQQSSSLSLSLPPLKDLRGRIVALAMDQHGCRFLQAKFAEFGNEEIDMILMEVMDHISVLMVHQFGNYLFQKLVEICSNEQRTRILLSLTCLHSKLIGICLNAHGTRSVQKLMDHLTLKPQIDLMMSVISRGALRLSKDNNGHHVIKHCLHCFTFGQNKYLLNEVANHCFEIATDKSGCCVLQSCIEHSQAECLERLVAEITVNAIPLAEDRYGNYVVQYLLEMNIKKTVHTNLLKQFRGNFVSLSCNKFASNVVEKCLLQSTREERQLIVLELLRSPDVSFLLLDPYGNYVIQTALSVSEGILSRALYNLVRAHSSSMRNNQYGKKVLACFEKGKQPYVH